MYPGELESVDEVELRAGEGVGLCGDSGGGGKYAMVLGVCRSATTAVEDILVGEVDREGNCGLETEGKGGGGGF